MEAVETENNEYVALSRMRFYSDPIWFTRTEQLVARFHAQDHSPILPRAYFEFLLDGVVGAELLDTSDNRVGQVVSRSQQSLTVQLVSHPENAKLIRMIRGFMPVIVVLNLQSKSPGYGHDLRLTRQTCSKPYIVFSR